MKDKKTPKIKKSWVWVLSVLTSLGIIVGIAAFYLSRQWKPILDRQLKDLVINSSDSLYHIEYSKFSVNVISGNASISNFKLIPDSAVYLRLKAVKKAPDNLYHLSVKTLVLKRFHPKILFREQKLNIDQVLIVKPTLFITNQRQPYNDTISTEKKQTLYHSISKVFKEVRFGEVILKDINFTFYNKSNKIPKKTTLKKLDVKIKDVMIDSLSAMDKTRFYYTKNVEVNLKNYRIATPDSLYYFTINNFAFSGVGNRLKLVDVNLLPRYNSKTFFEKVGYAKDRLNLNFKQITLGNIDIHQFIRNQRVFASNMVINHASLAVDNNNSYPKRLKDRTLTFPHQQLQQLSLDLKIDTLDLKNTTISYAKYNAISQKTGRLTFTQLGGRILNVTNDSAALVKNHYTDATLTSLFMNKGKLDVKFRFNLTDKLGSFEYSGNLGAFNGKRLNDITVPLGMVEIQSAKIQKMSFRAKADQNTANGTMEFVYKDLKVHVLKREESGKIRKQGWISSLANVFIIESQNPNQKGVFTTGRISYKRPKTMSFFAFLWQSLFTGVKESIGVSKERETKLRATAERIDSFFERMKKSRAENKPERERKREERKKNREKRRNK